MRPLIDQLTRALGLPASTPEQIVGADGRLAPAHYRVFRWRCPACGGGENDPQRIYRPLAVDSNGNVWCSQSRCALDLVAREVAVRLDARQLLDSLDPS